VEEKASITAGEDKKIGYKIKQHRRSYTSNNLSNHTTIKGGDKLMYSCDRQECKAPETNIPPSFDSKNCNQH